MSVYKPLRLVRPAIFFYELFRFIDALKEMRVFALINDIGQPDALQMLVWVAPNMLFPLMTLFLFLDLAAYKPYIPLYIAGKCATLASTLRFMAGALFYPQENGARSLFFMFFLTLGDLICIIAFALIRSGLKKSEKKMACCPQPVTTTRNEPGDET
ncbi:MAG: hypothetical protein LBB48_10090 [Treponema sp.]|jgi:hypothetical protein|nr:hypothetical protein [Treponema sp.]